MERHVETIGSFSGRDLREYIANQGPVALADECSEVTGHIKTLIESIGSIVQEHSAACIIGGISLEFTLRGAGDILMAGVIGQTSHHKVRKEDDEEDA